MNDEAKIAEARRHVQRLKGFLIHGLVFVCVMSGLVGLNIVTNAQIWTQSPSAEKPGSLLLSHWWVLWPLLGWGIGLLGHALLVFNPFRLFGREWEERKIQQHLRRMQH